MSKDKFGNSQKMTPVVFMDSCYKSRTIVVGDDKLHVKDGQVTATTAAQVEALRDDSALTEVK